MHGQLNCRLLTSPLSPGQYSGTSQSPSLGRHSIPCGLNCQVGEIFENETFSYTTE